MDFGTCPTGWHIEGDLPNQVAVSTGSTVAIIIRIANEWLAVLCCALSFRAVMVMSHRSCS